MNPKKQPYLWRLKYGLLAIKDVQETKDSPFVAISGGLTKTIQDSRRQSLNNPSPSEFNRGDVVITESGEMYIFIAGFAADMPVIETKHVKEDANFRVLKEKGLAWGVKAIMWREADEYVVVVRLCTHV